MFNIEFVSDEPEFDADERGGLPGLITLGDESERFLASLSVWTRQDYERQWREAAQRLLDGEERTAFFTSAFQFWRPMWNDAGTIRVQEAFLPPKLLATLGERFDINRTPYELIEDYESMSEDGAPLSEWRITIDDLRHFVSAA